MCWVQQASLLLRGRIMRVEALRQIHMLRCTCERPDGVLIVSLQVLAKSHSLPSSVNDDAHSDASKTWATTIMCSVVGNAATVLPTLCLFVKTGMQLQCAD